MDIIGLVPIIIPNPGPSVSSALSSTVLLYLGPETIMPITSVLAAGVGFLLIFWRHVTTTIRSAYRRLFIRRQNIGGSDPSTEADD